MIEVFSRTFSFSWWLTSTGLLRQTFLIRSIFFFYQIYFLYLAPIKKIIDIFILVLLCRRWYDAYDVFQYDQKNANLFADIWEHSCGGLHFRRRRFLKTIKIIFPSFYVAVISSLKEEIEFSFQTTPIDAYCLLPIAHCLLLITYCLLTVSRL